MHALAYRIQNNTTTISILLRKKRDRKANTIYTTYNLLDKGQCGYREDGEGGGWVPGNVLACVDEEQLTVRSRHCNEIIPIERASKHVQNEFYDIHCETKK